MKKIKYLIVVFVLIIVQLTGVGFHYFKLKDEIETKGQMEIQDCTMEKETDEDGNVFFTVNLQIKNYRTNSDYIPSVSASIKDEEYHLDRYARDEEYGNPNTNKRIPPGRTAKITYYIEDYDKSIQKGETMVFTIDDYSLLKSEKYSYVIE